jgi:hypothetical protein
MRKLPYFTLAFAASLTACELDNYTAPETMLEGRVVFQGQPVGLRQNAVELELWQDGYELDRHIPVHVAQDGTFSAKLFDGEYKLVRKQNNGPWVNNPDTMLVRVSGSTSIDVPVQPFFVIDQWRVQRNNSTLQATVSVNEVVPGRRLERVALFVGKGVLVDARYNLGSASRASGTTGLAGPITLEYDLSRISGNRDYVYARVGVKTAGVEEMIYTEPQKIQLR